MMSLSKSKNASSVSILLTDLFVVMMMMIRMMMQALITKYDHADVCGT